MHAVEQLKSQLAFYQRSNELEAGRNEVLRMVATGHPLPEILQTLCEKANMYSPDMYCSILTLDPHAQTLHPVADSGLPDFYTQALDGVKAGQGVGSCGTVAFSKKRVLVEDINTHPYWTQYRELALSAGLQACWSEPIMGKNDRCYGTFAMYYAVPKAPSEEDIRFIELSANLAAVVYENDENRLLLLRANNELTQTLDERTRELVRVNQTLQEAMAEQGRSHHAVVMSEKVQTTKALVVGVAHEINTPVGNAVTSVTSVTSARDYVSRALNMLKSNDRISRVKLEHAISSALECLNLTDGSLDKASQLINKFKSIDINEYDNERNAYDIEPYINSVVEELSTITKTHQLHLDIENIAVNLSKLGLREILVQLIDNSVVHGFKYKYQGNICLHVAQSNGDVVINYQDDGVGIPASMHERVFEPFYVQDRMTKGLGLGLNIVINIVELMFGGTIKAVDAPVGARFEIRLPMQIR